MSLVEKLCKEIGVEVEEVWMGNDGWHYSISKSGELISNEFNRLDYISRVLSGELKPAWKPNEGETYYVPALNISAKYVDLTWESYPGDYRNYERNIVFKTKEEAINMTEKILEFLKEERQNGTDIC